MFKIYCIENKISKTKYVGKTSLTIEERFKQHKANASKGIKSKLYDAMRSYGIESFQVYLIQTDIKSIEESNTREKFHINILDTLLNGYNLTEGGDGGATRVGMKNSESMKQKQSISQLGKPKQNPGLTGKYKKSKEHKEKLSKINKGKKWMVNEITDHSLQVNLFDVNSYKEQGYIFGRSKSTSKKLSEANSGKDFLSPDSRESLRLRNKSKIWICNQDKSFMIQSSEFSSYETQGYQKGRKLKS